MTYNKTNWVDNTNPAISADNLNKIENELENLDSQMSYLTDNFVEIGSTGTNPMYKWIKYENGIYYCWVRNEIGNMTMTTATVGTTLYRDPNQYSFDYDVPFEIQSVDAVFGNFKNGGWGMQCVYETTTGARQYLAQFGSQTVGGALAHCLIIGRWK